MIRRMIPEAMVVAVIAVSMSMAAYMVLEDIAGDVGCDSLRMTTTRALHDAQVVAGGLPPNVTYTEADQSLWNLPEKAWGAGTSPISPERRGCPSEANEFVVRAAGSYVSMQCREHGTTKMGERPDGMAEPLENVVARAELVASPRWWQRNLPALGLIVLSALGALFLRQSRQAAIVRSDHRARTRMRFAPK